MKPAILLPASDYRRISLDLSLPGNVAADRLALVGVAADRPVLDDTAADRLALDDVDPQDTTIMDISEILDGFASLNEDSITLHPRRNTKR